MNKSVTSKEAILTAGKEIIMKYGYNSLNMREVAKHCGVSVGSIYNYFDSKGDLMIATVESIWIEVIDNCMSFKTQEKFDKSVVTLFNSIKMCSDKYSSFFSMHSMGVANVDKDKGRKVMNKYFTVIKENLLDILNNDTSVRDSAFTNYFTKKEFIDFVFANIISILAKQLNDCNFLAEVIRRIIY